jgi:hypothetical protein
MGQRVEKRVFGIIPEANAGWSFEVQPLDEDISRDEEDNECENEFTVHL